MLAVDGTSACSQNMLEGGRPWNLEVLPGSRVILVLAHQGTWDSVQLSIADQQLVVVALPRIEQAEPMTSDAALQILRVLEPAYASASTRYPGLTQSERHSATLQVSLQGKVC